jgi:glycosyltransferase involved in cell wall biosynthesis
MKIIWCGNSYYNSPFKVGCNYYSELLAEQNNRVLFISPPISPLHNRQQNQERFLQKQKKIHKVFDNYVIYTPYTLLPPIKHLPGFLFFIVKIWHKFTLPNMIANLKKNDFYNVDILVIDSYMFLPLIHTISAKKVIVRITDNLSGFGVGKGAIKAEKKIISLANNVIYTATQLKHNIDKLNKNNTYIPNGVDINKFIGDFNKPEIFKRINIDVIIYIGAIESWFDFDLLYFLAQQLPNKYFLIIGPVKYKPYNFDVFKNTNNIDFYGKIDNKLVPNYLKYSKVGIIPFKINNLVEYISPLKLYEYMASGLPVVATKWNELVSINSPAYLAQNNEQFLNYLNIALIDENNKKYINFAKQNDWVNKLEKIKELI